MCLWRRRAAGALRWRRMRAGPRHRWILTLSRRPAATGVAKRSTSWRRARGNRNKRRKTMRPYPKARPHFVPLYPRSLVPCSLASRGLGILGIVLRHANLLRETQFGENPDAIEVGIN